MTRGRMKFLTAAMFAVVALWGWGGMHVGSTAHAGQPTAEQPAATPTPTPGSDEGDESAPDTCVEDEAVSDTNDIDPTCPPSPSPTPTATPTPTPTPTATPTPTPTATEQAVTGGVLGTSTGPSPVQAAAPTVPQAGIGLPYGIAALIAGIGALMLLGARRRRLRR
jgi:hypothetical protein